MASQERGIMSRATMRRSFSILMDITLNASTINLSGSLRFKSSRVFWEQLPLRERLGGLEKVVGLFIS
jgi:nitrate/nitrite-specific signal transduction histidine kinase